MDNVSRCYYLLVMPAKPPAPSDIADKFMLRLPEGMRDRLKDAAARNGRSMNAEIITRLNYTFDADAITSAVDRAEPSKIALLEAARELLRRVDEDLAVESGDAEH